MQRPSTRVARTCVRCGTGFAIKPSKVATGRGRYCCQPCAKRDRYASAEARFWRHVRQTAGCWEWMGSRHSNGYGHFTVDGKTMKIHRFAYNYFYGDLTADDHVLHMCDNRGCVHPGHLMKGDHAENMRQKTVRGRNVTPWTAKMTPETVRELRTLRAGGWSFIRLARRFGIGKSAAANIAYGRTWRHVV